MKRTKEDLDNLLWVQKFAEDAYKAGLITEITFMDIDSAVDRELAENGLNVNEGDN